LKSSPTFRIITFKQPGTLGTHKSFEKDFFPALFVPLSAFEKLLNSALDAHGRVATTFGPM